jgi:hypothetical protein
VTARKLLTEWADGTPYAPLTTEATAARARLNRRGCSPSPLAGPAGYGVRVGVEPLAWPFKSKFLFSFFPASSVTESLVVARRS